MHPCPKPRIPSFAVPLAAAIFAFCLGAVQVAPALAAEQGREFNRSFPLESGDGISLANLAGSVTITEGSGSQVVVRAVAHVEASSASETQKILDGLGWERARRGDMANGWAVAYPLDDYRRVHNPRRDSSNAD